MLAVGAVVRRKSDKTRWRVEAIDAANGSYVLSPADAFGQNVSASAEELRRWGVVAEEPPRPDATSASGWQRLAQRAAAKIDRRRQPLYASTPEEALAAGEREAARAAAERIARDPAKLADHAVGLLPVSDAVGVALDHIHDELVAADGA